MFVVKLKEINLEFVFRCDSSIRFCNLVVEYGGVRGGERYFGV